MPVLFIHQNYPAQFGHVASFPAQRHGYRCTFLSEQPPGHSDGVERVPAAPGDFAHVGRAGVEMVRRRYSLDVSLPRMPALYEGAVHARSSG